MSGWDEEQEEALLPEPAIVGKPAPTSDHHRTEELELTSASEDKAPVMPEQFKLVLKGDYNQAVSLMEASPWLWQQLDADGHSVLHWGALAGSVPFVSHCVASGVPVDVTAPNLQTPLMWAVLKGRIAAARILLEARADPLAKDSLGATAAVLAVQHKQHSALLLLLSHDTRERQLRVTDNNGCGPAHWAAYKGDLTSLKLLDYFDADLNTSDHQQMTPLHRAITGAEDIKHTTAVCEFLLEKEADPTQVDSQGRTCLDLASAKLGQGDRFQQMGMQRLADRLSGDRRSDGTKRTDDPDVELGSGKRQKRSRDGKEGKEGRAILINPSHLVAPTFWLVSVSLATFHYLTVMRKVCWRVSPCVASFFELGVPASLALFFWVATANPGKVPPRIKSASGVEDFMAALRSCSEESVPDFSRLCTTTWVLKGLRTKYCVRTGACVEEFDHFCGWLNCAIGKGNHRAFIVLAFTEVFTQLCNLYLCWSAASELVRANRIILWLAGVAMEFPVLALIALLHSFTAPPIFFLLLSQLRLVAVNMTTNESINAFRYDHFWVELPAASGQFRRVFRNPFDKGSPFLNCMDFWWTRRRSDRGPEVDVRALHTGCSDRQCKACPQESTTKVDMSEI